MINTITKLFRKKVHLYVEIKPNQLSGFTLENKTEKTIKASTPFSSDKLLISDLDQAEVCKNKLLKSLNIDPGKHRMALYFHLTDTKLKELSQVEEMAINDFGLSFTNGMSIELYFIEQENEFTPLDFEKYINQL